MDEDELAEAQRNLERCLEALDERGEAGLQHELDRIYPQTQHLHAHTITTPEGIEIHVVEGPPIPSRQYDPGIDTDPLI